MRRPAAPSTTRRLARADGIEESERSSARSGSSGVAGKFLKSDSRLRHCPGCDADAQRILPREIERDVFVLLEEAHLADALGGDAAGGDVGDGAGCKLDARLRDIDFVGDHRNADGFQVRDRRVHQRKQNIEVVNHHVVDHVDIQAARRENAQAMDFEKHGARNDLLRRDDRGIEALDVADLQNAAGALRRMRSAGRLLSSEAAMGFSTSTSRPASSRRQPTRACSLVGTATLTASMPAAASASRSANHLRAEFRGDLAGALGVGVNDADEFGAFEFAPHAHVVPAEFSGADHGNANGFLAHDFVFTSAESVCECLNGDARFIRGANQGFAVEQQRAARVDRRAPWHSSGASLRWFSLR